MKIQRKQQGMLGFTMIEVLIAILIVSFSLLGMAGLVTRSTSVEVDAIQRTQALMMVRDMVERIQLNRVDALAGRYGRADALMGAVNNCTGVVDMVERDFCEWGNQLAGVNESQGGSASSVLLGARGCVTLVPGSTNAYVVTVSWRGLTPVAAPADVCGVVDGEDLSVLRAATSRVELGRLDG
ncbi:MAG TPA: type IV pilus modification protein PilV [Burkholderiaceae bacterium]|nr:type IV pilus modification protein PilV [Burkholderiaceae bacterium]